LAEIEIPTGRPGRPGRPGSALNEGRPGIVLAEGSPGTELSDGRPGRELALGRPGSEEAGAGAELPVGTLGREEADGTLGIDPVDGRLGIEDGMTQNCRPFVLEAVTEPPPPGEVALPLPDAVTGLGRAGIVGVPKHCFPVGRVGKDVGRLGTEVGTEVGTVGSEVGSDVGSPGTDGRDETPGSDGSEDALGLAPLGKTLAAPIAMAATPAAPAVRRMIRP
jgi:hypothetical protein